MDAGLFDMLHDPADDHFRAVTEGIHIDLDGLVQKLVDQDRMLGRGLHGGRHVAAQVVHIIDDLHGPAAQHIGRTDHDRIADPVGHLLGFFEGAGHTVLRLAQSQLVQHLLEALPVLGPVDGVRRGADDRHAGLFQGNGQLERCLSAELDDHPVRLLHCDDIEDILQGQRLEIEAVGGVVVGGDGLRVAVDHDGLVAVLGQGKDTMHAAVIEFDPLADPVRPAAQDHDLLPVGRLGLALLFIGGVEIGRVGLEFGGTGIHALEDRQHLQGQPQGADLVFASVPELGQDLVGEAELLGLPQLLP